MKRIIRFTFTPPLPSPSALLLDFTLTPLPRSFAGCLNAYALLFILPVSQNRWTTVKTHARTRKILSQTRRERPTYFIWKWNMRRIGQRGIISHAVYIFGISTSEAFTKACGGYGSKEITYSSLDHRHRLTLNINLKTLNLFSSQKSQKINANQILQAMQAGCDATKLPF